VQTLKLPTFTFEGPVSGTGGVRVLAPTESVSFANPANSFTGGIEVVEGILLLRVSNTIPDANDIRIGDRSALWVGDFSAGVEETIRSLTCTGILSFQEVGLARLRVMAPSSIAGCYLFLRASPEYLPAASITLIRNESGTPVSGTFDDTPEGKTFILNGATMHITYRGGASGNDVVLVMDAASPVPAALQVVSGAPQAVDRNGYTEEDVRLRAVDAQGRGVANVRVRMEVPGCFYYPNGRVLTDAFTDAGGYVSFRLFADSRQTGVCLLRASVPGSSVSVNAPMHIYDGPEVTIVPVQASITAVPGQPFDFAFEVRHSSGMSMVGSWLTFRVDGRQGTADATITGLQRVRVESDSRARGRALPNAGNGSYRIVGFEGSNEASIPVTQVAADQPVALLVQGIWWAGEAENGWGMSIIQHGEKLFAVIFGYDNAGHPTWWVMPDGEWNAGKRTFTGALYSPRSAPYYNYDAALFTVRPAVGSLTLAFSATNRAHMEFTIGGFSGAKSIEQLAFGVPGPSGLPIGLGIDDMWWGGLSQNGWGVAVLRHFNMLFSVWYTYDASGLPTWYVMPSGNWNTAGSALAYEGTLYRTTGSPFVAPTYDRTRYQAAPVGTFRLRFTDGVFEYQVDGRPGSAPLVRTPF